MVYAKEPTFLQFLILGISTGSVILGSICASADKKWNNADDGIRLDSLRKRYSLKSFTFEQTIIIEENLGREYTLQVIAIVLLAVVLLLATIHLYLCFIFSNLYYRKHFNIYFHSGGFIILLLGACCYLASFLKTNDGYNRHFDIIYEGMDKPVNPCKFPQLEFGFVHTVAMELKACQDTWTKFIVALCFFTIAILYFCTACVIGCFVEEEDSAELLYRELEMVTGGPYPPLSSLPPLPYYARPLANSPTGKKRSSGGRIQRVEVPENWTTPIPNTSVPTRKFELSRKSVKN